MDAVAGGQRAGGAGRSDGGRRARRRVQRGPGRRRRRHPALASRCRACPTSGCCRSAWSQVPWRWRRSCLSRAPGWPRPRRTRTASRQPNTDIVAQGVGNVVSGFFRGMPVGGSVGQTALNVSAGARTRWAAIWSGVWMLAILAALSPAGRQGGRANPGGGAHFRRRRCRSALVRSATILRTGRISQIAVTTTFLATLFLPGRGRGGHRGGAVAAAAAEQGRDGPVGGGTRPGRRRPLHRTTRHRPHCPASRSPCWMCTAACSMRGAHPAGPPARPQRVPRASGGAAPAGSHLPGRHLRQSGRRLRRPPRRS